MDSVGQQRMAQLHGGRRDKLEISPNLWAGVGLVRGGAGTALVGDPQTVAARIREYQDVGIDTFILSGYPHLEEAYRFAELVFPLLSLAAAEQRDAASASIPGRSAKPSPTTPAAGEGIAVMSLIESLPRVRAWRLPRADGLVQWIVPLAILVVWQAACAPGWCRRACCRRRATWRWRAGSCCCRASCARNIWVSFWRASAGFVDRRRHRLCLRAGQRPVAAQQQAHRHHACRWCATSRIWR